MSSIEERLQNLSPAQRRLVRQRLRENKQNLHEENTPDLLDETDIPRYPDSGPAPLSFGQSRLWFIQQLEPEHTGYNRAENWRLSGTLDSDALQRTLVEIARRHEAMRTKFVQQNGEPFQVVVPAKELPITTIDLRHMAEVEQNDFVNNLFSEQRQKPFDLAKELPWRFFLIQLEEREHILLYTTHHIATDGWSWNIFRRELSQIYSAFVPNQPSPLPELPLQYVDFAVWQRQLLVGNKLEQQIAYWRTQLAQLSMLQLPLDYPRPNTQTYNTAKLHFDFPNHLVDGLNHLSQANRATLFMTLLTGFKIVLYRYSGQTDIVVGSPIAGRNRQELESMIGLFVNTLVLRTRFDQEGLTSQSTFVDLLNLVKKTTLNAYANQEVPFERLVQELQPERRLNYPPLCQVAFVFQSSPRQMLDLPGLDIETVHPPIENTPFDLNLHIRNQSSYVQGELIYNSDLFDTDTIQRMAGHFQTLLHTVVTRPEMPISELPLLTEAERHKLLVEWNDTATDSPQEVCIHHLFEEQAVRTPDATAVVFKGKKLTYEELNIRANQLAHWLKKHGIGAEMIVGLYMERSIEAIIGILGILKSGAAYVPLDPTLPSVRIAKMVSDTGLPLVIMLERLPDSFPLIDVNVVSLTHNRKLIEEQPRQNLSTSVTARNLAYVIYTSGSTGQPKGVEVEHRSLINYVEQIQKEFNLGSGDRSLLFASLSFDTSIQDIFVALTAGLTLYLRTPEMLNSVEHFLTCCHEWGLTYIAMPTAYWHEIVAYLSDETLDKKVLPWPTRLRVCYVGGEKFQPVKLATWHRLMKGRVRLVNGYGPTETAIACTLCDVTSVGHLEGEVPIGRPIQNMQAYILDSYLNPVPVGVPGELHIGGIGLARGYLNQPTLTAERFIQNPFGSEDVSRLYKTGDLVRYWPDGRIEYLGRTDSQVKIRGFRIELGEIERTLLTQNGVNEAVVVAREENPEDKRLVAYVVKNRNVANEQNEEVDTTTLRAALKQTLPDYMIPPAFVFLEAIPLTSNNKLNYDALPIPDFADVKNAFVAPRTSIEVQTAEIWSELLQIEPIGIHDNFFELGGHSLKAVQLIYTIRNAFQIDVPLRRLFETPTIEGIAEYIAAYQKPSSMRAKIDSEKKITFSSLVSIQPHGSKRPFFLVPGGGGGEEEFLIYAQLIYLLGPDQPVYGFYARGLKDQQPFHTDVSQMAADYLSEMRVIQPEGPYLLGGECIGGKVAYEMACQLQKQGRETEKLILMNTSLLQANANPPSHFPQPIDSQRERVQHHVQALSARSFGQRLRYLAERFHIIQKRLLPLTHEQKRIEHRRRTRINYTRLLRQYRPEQPYFGAITLLHSEDHSIRNPTMGWDDLAICGLEIYSLLGNRDSYIGRHVATTAARLNACLIN